MSTLDQPAATPVPLEGDRAHAVFGQVMGLVAFTLGFLALGAYIGRDLSGGSGLLFFIASFACIFGLSITSARGNEQIAIAFLFALGLTLGLAVAPVLNDYANAEPAALWQAAGATGGFVAACGSYGYATRRDLSSWSRVLFWALLALIVFGVNRVRRAGRESVVPIAASIFLDIFNVFLFFLQLFGNAER
jgi:FtsH-binding integral membrane protein